MLARRSASVAPRSVRALRRPNISGLEPIHRPCRIARFRFLLRPRSRAILPPVLLHFVGHDKVYIGGWIHFGAVALEAGGATVSAVALTVVGARQRDGYAVLVGCAFSVMAALLCLHGLATPGVLVRMNGVRRLHRRRDAAGRWSDPRARSALGASAARCDPKGCFRGNAGRSSRSPSNGDPRDATRRARRPLRRRRRAPTCVCGASSRPGSRARGTDSRRAAAPASRTRR